MNMFESPVAKIIMFDSQSVITTSGETTGPVVPPPAPNPSVEDFCV